MIVWGIQAGFFKDTIGVKVFFMVKVLRKNFMRTILLKRNGTKPVKGPQMEDPTMLTEVPKGKVIEPEDIINGFEFDKPLEPEDM